MSFWSQARGVLGRVADTVKNTAVRTGQFINDNKHWMIPLATTVAAAL